MAPVRCHTSAAGRPHDSWSGWKSPHQGATARVLSETSGVSRSTSSCSRDATSRSGKPNRIMFSMWTPRIAKAAICSAFGNLAAQKLVLLAEKLSFKGVYGRSSNRASFSIATNDSAKSGMMQKREGNSYGVLAMILPCTRGCLPTGRGSNFPMSNSRL
jgi:hypothetical protein